MIGAITLTSCASDAECTRSVCRSSEISRFPTTTASATLYLSSSSTGATGQSCPVGGLDSARCWYQTFHSSNEMWIRLSSFLCARTASAVALTDSTKWSMSTAEARNEPRSPSSSQ